MSTTERIIQAIENSELWVRLNNRMERTIKESGKALSPEQYQAIRNIMISKVMAEDPNVALAAMEGQV